MNAYVKFSDLVDLSRAFVATCKNDEVDKSVLDDLLQNFDPDCEFNLSVNGFVKVSVLLTFLQVDNSSHADDCEATAIIKGNHHTTDDDMIEDACTCKYQDTMQMFEVHLREALKS